MFNFFQNVVDWSKPLIFASFRLIRLKWLGIILK